MQTALNLSSPFTPPPFSSHIIMYFFGDAPNLQDIRKEYIKQEIESFLHSYNNNVQNIYVRHQANAFLCHLGALL